MVVPLHGSLSKDEQVRVFAHPPRGHVKIVLATNIAETSVTIDDVTWVVDSCRMKQTEYDPGARMGSLVETFAESIKSLLFLSLLDGKSCFDRDERWR